MQRLWEIELTVARSAPIAEFAQKVHRMNAAARKKIETTVAREAAERTRAEAAERERRAREADDTAAQIRRAVKEYEVEQQRYGALLSLSLAANPLSNHAAARVQMQQRLIYGRCAFSIEIYIRGCH
jgi:hypothetical protein